MMLFCNSSCESTSDALPRCYTITKVGRCVGNGCPACAPGSDGHELVSIKVEMGFVSGAVCARVPARADVRARASRSLVALSAEYHVDDKFTVASADASSDASNAPADPAGRDDRADDRCPICTLIHLAGALVLAEPPSLPLPDCLPAACRSRRPSRSTSPNPNARSLRRAHLPLPDIDLVPARPRASDGRADTPHGVDSP